MLKNMPHKLIYKLHSSCTSFYSTFAFRIVVVILQADFFLSLDL